MVNVKSTWRGKVTRGALLAALTVGGAVGGGKIKAYDTVRPPAQRVEQALHDPDRQVLLHEGLKLFLARWHASPEWTARTVSTLGSPGMYPNYAFGLKKPKPAEQFEREYWQDVLRHRRECKLDSWEVQNADLKNVDGMVSRVMEAMPKAEQGAQRLMTIYRRHLNFLRGDGEPKTLSQKALGRDVEDAIYAVRPRWDEPHGTPEQLEQATRHVRENLRSHAWATEAVESRHRPVEDKLVGGAAGLALGVAGLGVAGLIGKRRKRSVERKTRTNEGRRE